MPTAETPSADRGRDTAGGPAGSTDGPADSTGGPADAATLAWTAMQAFVTAQDRRGRLRDELDLGPLRLELLLRLADGPMTLREVAVLIGADPPSATLAVDKMQARGFVERTPHPDDNRRKLVHLTPAGRVAARAGHRVMTDPPPAVAALSPADLARLTDLLALLRPEPPAP
ncbi:MarR family winged helix-turn-helix transcriptional regulator [Streptantibioticus silvisoli]|uniref:MarR family transcriptional regulator n=1 Tax=Streptantibioticus silvisoli TaxID=2705255 RepID=A0ABT6VVI7_9ACTN|nr:MarR family transcriptional regulator [Streptantibioticus silvisoli]MDI5962497.1 MarR family transcriptional regulator [Streptantibioticus silvisoli]